jgi:hypothetical protein
MEIDESNIDSCSPSIIMSDSNDMKENDQNHQSKNNIGFSFDNETKEKEINAPPEEIPDDDPTMQQQIQLYNSKAKEEEMELAKARGYMALSKEIIQKFRDKYGNGPDNLTDFQKKELMDKIFQNYKIKLSNGEWIIPNLENPEHIEILKQQANVYVELDPSLPKYKNTENSSRADQQRRLYGLRYKDLSFKLKKEFSMDAIQLAVARDVDTLNLDDTLLLYPLINLPVLASNLQMLISRAPINYACDSFHAFRVYILALKLMTRDKTIRGSRKDTIMDLMITNIKNQHKNKDTILQLLTRIPKIYELDPYHGLYKSGHRDPEMEKKKKSSNNQNEEEEERPIEEIIEDLIRKVSIECETEDDIEEFGRNCSFIEKRDSWNLKDTFLCKEDIIYASLVMKMQECERVGAVMDRIASSGSFSVEDIEKEMYRSTFNLLHIHEVTIMKYLGFPEEMIGEFLTKEEIPEEIDIALPISKQMHEVRKNLNKKRNETLLSITGSDTGYNNGAIVETKFSPVNLDSDQAKTSCHLTPNEVIDFFRFLNSSFTENARNILISNYPPNQQQIEATNINGHQTTTTENPSHPSTQDDMEI